VLVGSGVKVTRPDLPGANLPFVVTYEDVLRCKNKKCEHYPGDRPAPVEVGPQVLIWGDHFGASDTAERLGYMGKHVTIVTPQREFAEWMEPCHRDVMLKRFNGRNGEGLKGKTFPHPVRILTNATVLEIRANGEVVLMDSNFERRTLKVDHVVLALVEKNDGIYEHLLSAGVKAAKIGDVVQIRNVRGAVTDGANAGLIIDEGVALNANQQLIANLPTEVAWGNGAS